MSAEKHFEAAILAAKPHARFALCGRISTYNNAVQGLPDLAAGNSKQISIQQFLVTEYFHLMPGFLSQMTDWIQSGRVISRETVEIGLDRAVAAFLMLFSGGNMGKMLVRLAE